ncbi:MAG: hypothetical protein RRY36_03550 [Bacteroidaceae bacterium]
MVTIINKSIPAKPRSKNYPTGTIISNTGGGNGGSTTIINQQSESTPLIKENDLTTQTDKNALSSLRTKKEILTADNKVKEELKAELLSKNADDTAKGLITFLKGLIANELSTFAKGIDVKGGAKIDDATITNALIALIVEATNLTATDGTIGLLNVIKGLISKGLATFEQGVNIKGGANIDNITEIVNFLKGFVSKDVATFEKGLKDTANPESNTGWWIGYDAQGNAVMHIDKIEVRMEALFKVLKIDQLSFVDGGLASTCGSMICSKVQLVNGNYRCFFNTSDGKVVRKIELDDQVRCQVFTGTGLKYYWRLVVGVGNDYIDLSDTDKDGSGVPAENDHIIQLGNRTNPDRRNAIILETYGTNAPSFNQYEGINSFTLVGKAKTTFSPKGNLITGDLRLNNGKTVVEYTDGKITETITSTDEKIATVKADGRNLLRRSRCTSESPVNVDDYRPYMPSKYFEAANCIESFKQIGGAGLYYYCIKPTSTTGIYLQFGSYTLPADILTPPYTTVTVAFDYYIESATDIGSIWTKFRHTVNGKSTAQVIVLPSGINTWHHVEAVVDMKDYDGGVILYRPIDCWNFAHINWSIYYKNMTLKVGSPKAGQETPWSSAPEDTLDEMQKRQETATNLVAALTAKAADLQNQIDGVVDSWYYGYTPSATNYPSNMWTDDVLREKHVGDTFVNTQAFVDNATTPDAGKAWRWVKNADSTYLWTSIADSDTVKALLAASKAQDAADGKRRVFVAKPTDAQGYDIGDLWVNANFGAYVNELLVCVTSKKEGIAFNISHWNKATKYTDDTATNALNTEYKTFATKTEKEVSTLMTAKDELKTSVSEIKQKADNISLKVSEIKVGGKNYFKKTTQILTQGTVLPQVTREINECVNGVYIVGCQLKDTFVRFANVIDSNGFWTVSFDLRGSQDTTYVGFDIDICDNPCGRVKVTEDNAWRHHVVTANVTNYSSVTYNFVDFSAFDWAYIFVRNIKIEKGNMATDWSPAPEDLASKKELEDTGIDIYNNRITLTADKTLIQANDGTPIAVFEMVNGKPQLKSSMINVNELLAGNIISEAIKTNGLNINDKTTIDKNGVFHTVEGHFNGYISFPFKDIVDSDAINTKRNVWKLVNDLNIVSFGGQIVLPIDEKYNGCLVNIFNSSLPPYTGATLLMDTRVTIENGSGFCSVHSHPTIDYISQTEVVFIGCMYQFLCVVTVFFDGSRRVNWVVLNGN